MIRQNLHSHTFYDDGQCTADMMVKGAIEAGLDSIGVCCHSPIIRQDASWCIKPRDINDFKREVYMVRDKYKGIIDVYCGVELDNLTERRLDLYGFDYVIGAVHYLPIPDGTVPHLEYETIDRFPSEDGGIAVMYREVDLSREALKTYVEKGYEGDAVAAAQIYYNQYRRMATDKTVDIVAHYDLITKFDEPDEVPIDKMIFNIGNKDYLEAAFEGMRVLVEHEKIFEINTGAVSRGYRTSYYPQRRLLKELRKMGGRITLSTDAHIPSNAGYMLDDAADYARDCGFKEIWVMDHGHFRPSSLKE